MRPVLPGMAPHLHEVVMYNSQLGCIPNQHHQPLAIPVHKLVLEDREHCHQHQLKLATLISCTQEPPGNSSCIMSCGVVC